jgi:hypothetical protein
MPLANWRRIEHDWVWLRLRGRCRFERKETTWPFGVRVLRWSDCVPLSCSAATISKPMLLLTNKDFCEFIELLNSNGVKFLVVGGHAVALHGYPRFTGDLDVWIATDPENAVRVAKVLSDFGFGSLGFSARDFTRPGYAIQLGRPPYRIDLLTSIDAVTFARAYPRRRTVRAGALAIPFIALEDLLKNKRAAGRPQDLADVAKLRAVNKPRWVKKRRRKRQPPKSAGR